MPSNDVSCVYYRIWFCLVLLTKQRGWRRTSFNVCRYFYFVDTVGEFCGHGFILSGLLNSLISVDGATQAVAGLFVGLFFCVVPNEVCGFSLHKQQVVGSNSTLWICMGTVFCCWAKYDIQSWLFLVKNLCVPRLLCNQNYFMTNKIIINWKFTWSRC